jgi:beta-lactamase regulating signal transducer with metallopeptidase domain
MPSAPVKFITPVNTITFAQTSDTINSISLINIIAFVWLFGIVVFSLYQFIIYNSFKKKIKRWSFPVTNVDILSVFDSLCDELKIKNKPEIRISKTTGSPMMFGFWKPVLYLQNIDYSDIYSLEVILKHELVHHKRHDLWYKLILLIANAIHWFNPFVYVMMKAANDDIEFSCDDEVIKNTDIAFRKKYSEVILNSVRKERLNKITLTTQFSSGKKAMKNRFINILDPAKKRRGIATLFLIITVIMIGGLLVGFTNEIPDNFLFDNFDNNIIPTEDDKNSFIDEKLVAAQIDGKWTILEIP